MGEENIITLVIVLLSVMAGIVGPIIKAVQKNREERQAGTASKPVRQTVIESDRADRTWDEGKDWNENRTTPQGRGLTQAYGLPEEGRRTVEKRSIAKAGSIPPSNMQEEPSDEFDLRRAVIYSEILTPKFTE